MSLLRALLVFALLWGVLALAVAAGLHLTRRQRWALVRLLTVSAVAALLACGVLWGVVLLF